ncbi:MULTISPECIES: zinc ribbon domain-containing protein [unclassified Streptomyces]|uniref:Zn-ribbon domain-containing OB-fold protein n=1 Tax=unclassified Streptomyces TaxID=2593676 RepID=UPI003252F0BF
MSSTGFGTAPAKREETGLVFQRCRWCQTASFRRLLCPVCASSDLESERSDGYGVVVRSGVVNRYTGAARNESLVRFPEGFVFRCRVVGAAPHLVHVGAQVRPVSDTGPDAGEVVFELCEEDRPVGW